MVAYLDRGFVEDGKIEVGKEEVAHLDIAAIIAIEGLVDDVPAGTLKWSVRSDISILYIISFSIGFKPSGFFTVHGD